MLRLCKSFIDRIIALFGVTMIGSQRNEDGDVNENGKKPIGLKWQNNNFARASRFFCTFHCRRCKTTTWKGHISRFITRTLTQDNDFLFISWTSIKSFTIQFKEKIANICWIEREVWGSASSLFNWRFRSRRRRCCLIVCPLILWRCVLHVLLLFGWRW